MEGKRQKGEKCQLPDPAEVPLWVYHIDWALQIGGERIQNKNMATLHSIIPFQIYRESPPKTILLVVNVPTANEIFRSCRKQGGIGSPDFHEAFIGTFVDLKRFEGVECPAYSMRGENPASVCSVGDWEETPQVEA